MTFAAFRRAYILVACAEGVGEPLLRLLTGSGPVEVAQVAMRAANALRRLGDTFWPQREEATDAPAQFGDRPGELATIVVALQYQRQIAQQRSAS